MKNFKSILILICFISFTSAYANKDRIEKPVKYRFVFENKYTVNLNNPNEALLRSYCDDIVNHKKRLLEAQVTFKTGEVISVKYDSLSKLTAIKISGGKRETSVPEGIIQKISEIHFQTIALIWNGDDKDAFSAKSFYIQFDMGTEKLFDKFPYLQLNFEGKKFLKPTIYKPVSATSTKESDF